MFASYPEIVGKTVPIPGDASGYRVAGVLPPGVDYPGSAHVYVPALGRVFGALERYFEADVIARLSPGVSAEDAHAELQTIRARLTEEDPQQYAEMGIVITPLLESVVGDVSPPVTQEPFVGEGPNLNRTLFTVPERKTKDGTVLKWKPALKWPTYPAAYL